MRQERSKAPRSAITPPNSMSNWKPGAPVRLNPVPMFTWMPAMKRCADAGQVIDCAVLALGIRPNGKRSSLGVSVAQSEAEVHWRQFLSSLQQRGLHAPQLIISDDHQGLAQRAKPSSHRCLGSAASFTCSKMPGLYPASGSTGHHGSNHSLHLQLPDRSSAELRLKEAWRLTPKVPQACRLDGAKHPARLYRLCLPIAHQRRLRTSNP